MPPTVLRSVPSTMTIVNYPTKEFLLHLTIGEKNQHIDTGTIRSCFGQCISTLNVSVTNVCFESTTFNQVSNLGNCSVTRHKRVKLLKRRHWIPKHLVHRDLSKSAWNRLFDGMNLGNKNGQPIGQVELTLLDNPVFGGEEISASHFLILEPWSICTHTLIRCHQAEIRSPWDSPRKVSLS